MCLKASGDVLTGKVSSSQIIVIMGQSVVALCSPFESGIGVSHVEFGKYIRVQ